MDVYCTSKNSSPSWSGPDPYYIVYIGTSLQDAIDAVGIFTCYEKSVKKEHIPSALPYGMEKEIVKFYTADGLWFSIVKIQLTNKEDNGLTI